MKQLSPYNILVASGEHCYNKVMFKQLLQLNSIQIVQPDSCRLCSIPEILTVLFLCKYFNKIVRFHAGGVGLNEMVRHLICIDYCLISQTLNNRLCEYAQHLSKHFDYLSNDQCIHKMVNIIHQSLPVIVD